MSNIEVAGPAENADAAPSLSSAQIAILSTFIDFPTLAQRVPLCERSLREAIRRGRIASIKLPGARRVMFHWDSVRSALLRMQRGLDQEDEP